MVGGGGGGGGGRKREAKLARSRAGHMSSMEGKAIPIRDLRAGQGVGKKPGVRSLMECFC